MTPRIKKLSLFFALVMFLTVITTSALAEVDLSKRVELTIFTFGTNPRDMDKINEAISAITLEKLNCTVNIQCMTNWYSQYNISLASGEPIDLIWTAMWYSYFPYAFDGAWLDITDLVDEVTPDLRTLIGEDVWNMCKIKGRDYAIPNTAEMWAQWGVAWREDLRKKYNCPEIVDWETMEIYAEAILANEPGMIPFCDSSSGGLWHSYSEKNRMYVGLGNPQFSYGLGVSIDDPRELTVFHKTPEFLEYLETMRRWVEKGYIQPDVASSTDTGNAGMLAGKYAGSINTQGIDTTLNGLIVPARDAFPDWEIGYMNFGEMFKCSYRAHPLFMAFALPASCPNPERTLLFYQELLTNQELWQLLDMGIEGEHYTIDDEGYYVSLNDPINPSYLQSASGITNFAFNPEFKKYSEDFTWVLDYRRDHMEPYEVTNYFEGFAEDYSSYTDKTTAMGEINTQYTWPLLRGNMPNVEEALADVNRRLDGAGRMEVVENVIAQYQAYLDSIGVE